VYAQGRKTALHFACLERNLAIAKMLAHQAEVDLELRDKDGLTALMSATRRRAGKIVAMLLRAGAKVNAQARTGHTALMFAAALDDAAITATLLNARARLDIVNEVPTRERRQLPLSRSL